jgi:purine-binding chemotaxis protein CheW
LRLIAAYDQLAAAFDQFCSQMACCLDVSTLSPEERVRLAQAHNGIEAVIHSVDELLAFERSKEREIMAALDDNIQKQLSGKTLQVVSFALGSEEYGVDIAQVQEINRMIKVTNVPQAAQFMEGVINLRGRLIPIIDLRTRFGMERAERTKNTRIVVTEIGSKRLGMVVDSVSEVLRIPVEQIEDAPDLVAGVDTEYIRGVGKLEDRLIILLDLGRVISADEKTELQKLDAAA